jgi:hypothetical protein
MTPVPGTVPLFTGARAMSRGLILGQLDQDLACAVALGLVENPRVAANPDAITVHDGAMRPLGTVRGWLDGDDPLDGATRDYLQARREANATTAPRPGQAPWVAAAAIRTRDGANQRARAARERARDLLAQRGTFAQARAAGLKVLDLA